MKVTVRLPAALRDVAGGERMLEVDVGGAATVRQVLDALAADWPAVERRVRDETGAIRAHVNVFVGEVNVRDTGGQDSPVTEGSELHVIPAVSGG